MKTLHWPICLTLLLASTAAFAELGNCPTNPDHFTSIGLGWERTVSKTYTSDDSNGPTGATHHNFFGFAQTEYNADLRVPVTGWLTVNINGGPQVIETAGHRMTGGKLGVSVRMYLKSHD